MGGFIKVTLRDLKNKLTTRTISTFHLNGFLADYKNILEGDIEGLIINNEVDKEVEITKSSHHLLNMNTPFDYGYVFIDRVKKKVFFINNYDSISYFDNFSFEKEKYELLKKQNYIIKIGKNDRTEKIDIRKDYVIRDFREYKKLYSAMPYIKEITIFDVPVEEVTTMESVLDKLMIEREKPENVVKNRDENGELIFNFNTDMVITELNDWTMIEGNRDMEHYQLLFNHLMSENLLSEKEVIEWENEIKELSL